MTKTELQALFRQRRFTVFGAGNLISLTGNQLQQVIINWLVWDLTKSPFWLGIIAGVQFISVFLVGPVGGILADRYRRENIIQTCQVIGGVVALFLFLLYETDLLTLAAIVIAKSLLAILLSLSQPARMALTPSLVDKRTLPLAISVGSIIFNIAAVIGPAIAGVAIYYRAIGAGFLFNAFSYLALVFAVYKIKHYPIPEEAISVSLQADSSGSAAAPSLWRYVWSRKNLLVLIGLYAIGCFCARPITINMLPAFAEQLFEDSALGLAILSTTAGIGSVLFIILFGHSTSSRKLALRFIVAGALLGLMAILFSLAPSPLLAIPLTLALSGFSVLFGVSGQTLAQLQTNDTVRGRVMSMWFIILTGGPALGAFALGYAAEYLGLEAVFVASGLLLMVISTACLRKRVRQLFAGADEA